MSLFPRHANERGVSLGPNKWPCLHCTAQGSTQGSGEVGGRRRMCPRHGGPSHLAMEVQGAPRGDAAHVHGQRAQRVLRDGEARAARHAQRAGDHGGDGVQQRPHSARSERLDRAPPASPPRTRRRGARSSEAGCDDWRCRSEEHGGGMYVAALLRTREDDSIRRARRFRAPESPVPRPRALSARRLSSRSDNRRSSATAVSCALCCLMHARVDGLASAWASRNEPPPHHVRGALLGAPGASV
jgi:hypothetical protein